ncbi:MAG TPA: dihydrolipoamide acetyltransferase family protein [Armatimonadota bacterium]|nr:dihydrolipoamide acetyltransferase family protein [Armatimonadota bacterium]
MAENIYLPRLGQTMTEGKILAWLKKDGESVTKGDELYTLEYDKATINVESPADGRLKILIAEEETVPVGSVAGIVLGENENADLFDTIEVPASKKEEPDNNTAACVKAEEMEAARIKISPLARKLAEEYGVDISKVTAADPSGRISKEDVMRFHEQAQSAGTAAGAAHKAESADGREIKKIPLAGIRRVIAQRMTESAFTAPVVTYSSDADVTELTKLREHLNADPAKDGVRVSFTDLIIKAVALALKKNPHINIRLEDENICYIPDINIGVAVAAEKGLVVPVIKNADILAVEEIAKAARSLAEHARSGSLKPDEMNGGTFTISNLGMYGVDMFTPILNQPESAILGIGRIVEKPVVVEKRIEIRPMMVLSLTADHRVIDGAPAAQFLNEIKNIIERPYALLRD